MFFCFIFFFFSSRRRHTRCLSDWSSDVCSSDLDKIEVKLRDGRNFPATVVGTDEKTDIAVIKIDAKDLPVVQLGDSDAVRVGQFAFAIGAPFKLDYTFTYGVVSGKGRSKLLQSGGY